MLEQIGNTLLWAVVGLVLMVVGYKLFDIITPFEFDKEIAKGNVAVGVVVGAIFISVAIVVASLVA